MEEVKEKLCPKCNKIKTANLFPKHKGKKDGLDYACKACTKIYQDEYRRINNDYLLEQAREWKRTHHKEHLAYTAQWVKDNPERHLENCKRWAKNNPEKVKQAQQKFYKNNPDKIRTWTRKTSAKLRSTPTGKLRRNISTMICNALKGRKSGKHWECFVDYTLEELIVHLEKLFIQGMTWENYGKNGWEVDHKIPIAMFNFNNISEIKKCWALKNLQPLWSMDNKKKGKKLIY